jgi:hypothetical protein
MLVGDSAPWFALPWKAMRCMRAKVRAAEYYLLLDIMPAEINAFSVGHSPF